MILHSAVSRKFVAWGLLVCALALLWGGLVMPLSRWVLGSIEARDDLRFALARAQVAHNTTGPDEAGINAARQQLASLLLSGAQEADAAAQLQSSVAALLQIGGLQLDQLQAAPAVQVAGIYRLPLDVRAHGTEAAVMQLVSAIESAPLHLVIERAALRAQGDQIAVDMTLAAHWLPAAQTGDMRP